MQMHSLFREQYSVQESHDATRSLWTMLCTSDLLCIVAAMQNDEGERDKRSGKPKMVK